MCLLKIKVPMRDLNRMYREEFDLSHFALARSAERKKEDIYIYIYIYIYMVARLLIDDDANTHTYTHACMNLMVVISTWLRNVMDATMHGAKRHHAITVSCMARNATMQSTMEQSPMVQSRPMRSTAKQ